MRRREFLSGALACAALPLFAAEPRRLFARYFVEPWSLIGPAIADLAARGRAAS